MQFQTDETCPKCQKRVMVANTDLHPTDRDIAVRSSRCTDCGSVSNHAMSIRPAQVAVETKRRQLRITDQSVI